MLAMKWDIAGDYDVVAFARSKKSPPCACKEAQSTFHNPTVFVVDDDYFSRSAFRQILEDAGWAVEDFSDCESFLRTPKQCSDACLLLDVHFPGMGGMELLSQMTVAASHMPVILVSGSSGISEAVWSMKAGAADFIEKPVAMDQLLASVRTVFDKMKQLNSPSALQGVALDHLADLTARQWQIMNLVLAGQPSKNIAADLGISQRTVENHRASIMHKTGATSLPALARLVTAATPHPEAARANY